MRGRKKSEFSLSLDAEVDKIRDLRLVQKLTINEIAALYPPANYNTIADFCKRNNIAGHRRVNHKNQWTRAADKHEFTPNSMLTKKWC